MNHLTYCKEINLLLERSGIVSLVLRKKYDVSIFLALDSQKTPLEKEIAKSFDEFKKRLDVAKQSIPKFSAEKIEKLYTLLKEFHRLDTEFSILMENGLICTLLTNTSRNLEDKREKKMSKELVNLALKIYTIMTEATTS